SPSVQRRLGTADAVVLGLAAMMGTGVFAVWGPAAAAAGPWLLLSVVLAGVVAACNAASTADLAVAHPESGGGYVYARERVSPAAGRLAGVAFLVGKSASAAAAAGVFGSYVLPSAPLPAAILAVVVSTALNTAGVRWTSRGAYALVGGTLMVLLLVVVVGLSGSGGGDAVAAAAQTAPVPVQGGPLGVLTAAGLVFFAFAGYARIATLGEEVRDPAKTIPRAIPIALGVALVVYAAVATAVMSVMGSAAMASATAPLADAVAAAGHPGLVPVVRVGAVVAAVGALLALILGVSRTTLAMARDRHLPHALAVVHPRFDSPYRAEVAVGLVVAVLAATVDLRGAIGFSSFAVLLYYAIANAAAWTLGVRRVVPVLGFAGCVVLGFALPLTSVLAGLGVVALGAAVYWIRRARHLRET
ncbi:MAG: putative amino acid transporter, partial [Mycobacterium sp.]|nr:putative amino acid transporter [Mycobacterium sp.]